ncbi:T9SS type A sorting domain-containing protein [bacterium]|nr:T9SS type A sorting domain-containing protein [bacterium]
METKKGRNLFVAVILLMTGIVLFNHPLLAECWDEITIIGDIPEPRWGHSIVKMDTEIVVFGGADESGLDLGELWKFYKDEDKWERIVPQNNPPPPRKNHSAFIYDEKMYIFGGSSGSTCLNDFWHYDFDTQIWTQLDSSRGDTPKPRTEATMTVVGDKAYLQGGRNPATETIFKDLWVVYLNTFGMEKLADMGEYEGPRYGHSSAAVGNDIYICGGNGSPWGYHTGNLVYHTDGGTWDIVDWKPKAGFASFNQVMLRMYTTMLYRALDIFLFGGQCPKDHPYGFFPKTNRSQIAEEDTILCDMWKLNLEDSTVTRCADLPVALTQAAGVDMDGEFYIFGGMKSDGTAINTLYKYIEGDTPVEKTDQNPKVSLLYPNYPNPFNPVTTIRYTIPKSSQVRLGIFDLQGRAVENLIDQYQSSGDHSVSFDGSNHSSGVYFYKLEAERHTQIRKMLLIK